MPGKNMRAKTKHWRSLAALLAAAVLTLCSCAGRSSPESAKKPSYRLFYLNQEATAVITKDYVPYTRFASESAGATDTEGSAEVSSDITAKEASEMETEDYISDMLRQLANSDEVEYSAPLKGISILSRNLVDKNLTLNLSEGYEKLGNIQQILVRAAVVLTLTQLDDVDTVTILSGGQPVYDANGNAVGAQSADDFISSSGSEIQNYQRERLHLYFANRDGDKLIDTYRNVVYNSNISTERVVVEQVIKGPNSDVVYPTVNPDTKVIGVTTRDGVCYVNLDDTFLTDPYNVTSQVAVYSIVNALTQLSTVDQVQFSINGDTNVSFMENQKFQNLYTFNSEVVASDGIESGSGSE